jgi:hypothetical protein
VTIRQTIRPSISVSSGTMTLSMRSTPGEIHLNSWRCLSTKIDNEYPFCVVCMQG